MKRVPMFALLATAALPASAATIVNGSFEATPTAPGSYTQYGNGGNLVGWTVVGNPDNAVLSIANGYTEPGVPFTAQDGNIHLDLTGAGNTGSNGIYQNVATVVGQAYNLTFWLGNAAGDGTGNSESYIFPSMLAVTVNGINAELYENGNTGPQINWQQFTYNFTATGAVSRIGFVNVTPQGDNFTGLDNVSISAAGVPEPASWAMMIGGLGVVGGALRRRRAALRTA